MSLWTAQHEQFNKTRVAGKLSAKVSRAGSDLQTARRKELVELFYEVDKDRNGWLSVEEALSCLPPALCPDGEADDSIDWDSIADDDRITLAEW